MYLATILMYMKTYNARKVREKPIGKAKRKLVDHKQKKTNDLLTMFGNAVLY